MYLEFELVVVREWIDPNSQTPQGETYERFNGTQEYVERCIVQQSSRPGYLRHFISSVVVVEQGTWFWLSVPEIQHRKKMG